MKNLKLIELIEGGGEELRNLPRQYFSCYIHGKFMRPKIDHLFGLLANRYKEKVSGRKKNSSLAGKAYR